LKIGKAAWQILLTDLSDCYNYTINKKMSTGNIFHRPKIEIMGNIKLSTQLNRYNPLNRTFYIDRDLRPTRSKD